MNARKGLVMFALGLLVGGLLMTAVGSLRRSEPALAELSGLPDVDVKSGSVRFIGNTLPPGLFRSDEVRMGLPLSPPPVTGRVVTLETRTAPSFAPLEGRIERVAAKLGQSVKKGERLVLVRSGDLAGLERERRTSLVARATRLALRDRLKQLSDFRAASQNDLLVAEAELEEADLASRAARSRLQSLSITVRDQTSYWVLAGRDGVVVQIEAAPGKQVGPDKDRPVATVADLDEVLVLADLPVRDATRVLNGQEVIIQEPGYDRVAAHGTVEMVSPILDPERQTVPVRIAVHNVGLKIRPQSFVQATFQRSGAKPVVVVPTDAVVSDGASAVVFLQTAAGIFRRVPVLLGNRNKESVEIVAGVSAGDRIVVQGALLLLNTLDVHG